MDSDGPLLVETGGAPNVRYKGRLLYPERGPLSLPERLALACETGPERLHLVASPGLWHGVETLLSRIGEGSALLCVEADPLLARLSEASMPPHLAANPRVSFLGSAEPALVLEAASRLGRFRRCVPLSISGGAAFHDRAYAEAAAMLQAEFAAFWRSKAALLSMGRLWTRNIFRNLSRIAELDPSPLPEVAGPVVVCGAGPSLEASLGLIAAERDRLTVLACDTALPPLLDAGIVPDLVICLEGQAHNLPDFVPAAGRASGLVADLSSHPSTFRALGGNRHLSLVRIAQGPFLERLGRLPLPFLPCPPLGSVGVHAVHIARRLASGPEGGPVLLTGLDFAFEPGKTHARGSPSLRGELAAQDRLSRWPRQAASAFRPGVQRMAGGSPAGLTDPVLSAYAALLADELATPGPASFDLRGRGLPLGIPALDEAEVRRLLRNRPRHPDARPGSGENRPEQRALEAVDDFLAAERDRLDAIYAAMKGRSGTTRAELALMVAECDYLLWPLADDERLPALPQDLANRLLVEVEYWRWKLEVLHDD